MKKLLLAVLTLATLLTSTTVAFAYDGPNFPDNTLNSTDEAGFFNTEKIDQFFDVVDAETKAAAKRPNIQCPYNINLHITDLYFPEDIVVYVYAYYDVNTKAEGTWLLDSNGNTLKVLGQYDGYNELSNLTVGDTTIRPSSDGFLVSSVSEEEFAECPYTINRFIGEYDFYMNDTITCRIYEYRNGEFSGIWCTDNYGNTIDCVSSQFDSIVSNWGISLNNVLIYPGKSGFKTSVVASAK